MERVLLRRGRDQDATRCLTRASSSTSRNNSASTVRSPQRASRRVNTLASTIGNACANVESDSDNIRHKKDVFCKLSQNCRFLFAYLNRSLSRSLSSPLCLMRLHRSCAFLSVGLLRHIGAAQHRVLCLDRSIGFDSERLCSVG